MGRTRYAIVGTGGLGGYYGARLAHAGLDVHFLLHSDYDHVKRHGLCVESAGGDLSVRHPRAYDRPEQMPPCDVVLVCLKSTQNHLLKRLLPPPLAPDGVVVVMQNGLGVEADAAAVVGPDRVLGAMAFLCSHKVGPGHIRQMDYGQVRIGEYGPAEEPRGITDRMRSVAADLRRAGIEVELEEDLLLARWKKLVWNIPFNGLTVVLDATTRQIVSHPATRALARALMREVQRLAAACGRRIEDPFLEGMLEATDRMVPYRPSMKLDRDLGRPLEVEAIYGNPLRAGRQRGVEAPRIEALYQQLRFLDRPPAAGTGPVSDTDRAPSGSL